MEKVTKTRTLDFYLEKKKTKTKCISFPCKEALKISVENRPLHIKNCNECKHLERKLDESLDVKKHIWS